MPRLLRPAGGVARRAGCDRRGPASGSIGGVAGIEGLREQKRAHSRAATVDAALGLFAARGYDAVTVADICEAAQIAPRTFFRYFPAKEDVLAEPARELAARLAALIAAAPAGLPDAEVLRHALRGLGEHVVADRERLAAFFRASASASAVRSNPFVRLSDRERELAEHLLARRAAPAAPDWRTRLLVARAVASFRVWLGEAVLTPTADPLGLLDEVLAAG